MIANVPPGLITHSGIFVPHGPTGHVPSIEDIALSLSRLPRFGGHCRRPWNVLQHSLFVERLARQHATEKEWSEVGSSWLRLTALLHDAHEALTGDIPTHFKSGDMRTSQQALDERIFERFHSTGTKYGEDVVRQMDANALLAEALVVGPPALRTKADVQTFFGGKPSDEDVATLREFLEDPLAEDPWLAQKLFIALVDQNGGL